MIENTYQFLLFFVRRTRNRSYDWLRQLLNEYDVKIYLCFQNRISKQVVFPDILRKNIKISYNHICILLIAEQIDLALLFLISWYFLVYYSLLKQYFQKEHRFEFTWWSPEQLIYLNEWGYSFFCFVSSLSGFILKFAL